MSSYVTCSYCHLPVPFRRSRHAQLDEQPIYCCYGCNLAAQITGSHGEAGHANWMLTRLGIAVVLSMAVMVFSLPMYGQDVYSPSSPQGATLAAELTGLFQYISLALSAPVFVLLGVPILSSAFEQFRRGIASTDALVVLGVAATFTYSYISTATGSGRTYYETACMVLVLITLGRYLEATGKIKASAAVEALESLLPDEVRVIRGDRTSTIPTADVKVGDRLLVHAGERIAVDGRLIDGEAHVDERIVTGESTPVVRRTGCTVRAGTVNLDGTLTVDATAVGKQSTLGRLAAALDDAKRTKGHYERLADRAAAVLVPLVLSLAVVAAVLGGRRGGAEQAIMSALAVLLVSCPCALGIATPMAVWIAFGQAADRGVLFRSGSAIEALACVRSVAFDKTGTLTTGEPSVAAFLCRDNDEAARREAIGAAAGLGAASTHALSRSIVTYAQRQGIPPTRVSSVRTVPGRGIVGEIRDARRSAQSQVVRLGSLAMMEEASVSFDTAMREQSERILNSGQTITCLGRNDSARGIFTFTETLRSEARSVLHELTTQLGCRTVVLTGDHAARGAAVAQELGVETLAELSPEGKMAQLEQLRHKTGPVAMIGDGLNDAPALVSADVGVAMGCGADVTREAADVCLLGNDLTAVPWAIRLARRCVRTIKLNLFWAFSYNAVGIPLALTGRLSPTLAALAMVVSSLLVVTNSLRLKRVKI